MLLMNNYDKHKKKDFLKTMTKQNHIRLPISSDNVKVNKKGNVFVKQKKKGTVHMKSRGEYVPYDLQRGVRLEGGQTAEDIDEEEVSPFKR